MAHNALSHESCMPDTTACRAAGRPCFARVASAGLCQARAPCDAKRGGGHHTFMGPRARCSALVRHGTLQAAMLRMLALPQMAELRQRILADEL